MGCDIHIVAQKRDGNEWRNITGKFTEGPAPFDWRSYGLFGFLAGVRNYSGVTPIAEPRGLPSDLGFDPNGSGEWLGEHSFSWLSVDELAAFDYGAMMEDRRTTVQVGSNLWNGGATAEPGHGEQMTWGHFLGDGFMRDLEELKRIGAERIVFGFDS